MSTKAKMRLKLPKGFRYVLEAGDRASITVDKDTHEALRQYAKSKGMRISEATWFIIMKGFLGVFQEDPRHKFCLPIHQKMIELWEKKTGEKVPDHIKEKTKFPELFDK